MASSANNLDNTKSPQGVYNNLRLMHVCTTIVGFTVHLQTKDSSVWEGIFNTFSEEFTVCLDLAVPIDPKLNSKDCLYQALKGGKQVQRQAFFDLKDIVRITVVDVDLNYATKEVDKITTDADISGFNSSKAGEHRQLESWQDDDGDNANEDSLLSLDEVAAANKNGSQNNSRGWDAQDMFRYNERVHKVNSTYDEELHDYTIALSRHGKNDRDWRKKQERASAIAKEIECNEKSQGRLAKEDGSDNEEEKFSAVVRPTTNQQAQHPTTQSEARVQMQSQQHQQHHPQHIQHQQHQRQLPHERAHKVNPSYSEEARDSANALPRHGKNDRDWRKKQERAPPNAKEVESNPQSQARVLTEMDVGDHQDEKSNAVPRPTTNQQAQQPQPKVHAQAQSHPEQLQSQQNQQPQQQPQPQQQQQPQPQQQQQQQPPPPQQSQQQQSQPQQPHQQHQQQQQQHQQQQQNQQKQPLPQQHHPQQLQHQRQMISRINNNGNHKNFRDRRIDSLKNFSKQLNISTPNPKPQIQPNSTASTPTTEASETSSSSQTNHQREIARKSTLNPNAKEFVYKPRSPVTVQANTSSGSVTIDSSPMSQPAHGAYYQQVPIFPQQQQHHPAQFMHFPNQIHYMPAPMGPHFPPQQMSPRYIRGNFQNFHHRGGEHMNNVRAAYSQAPMVATTSAAGQQYVPPHSGAPPHPMSAYATATPQHPMIYSGPPHSIYSIQAGFPLQHVPNPPSYDGSAVYMPPSQNYVQ